MAESVQFNIENTIEELEQLKRVGLFSELEVGKVINKRRTFEYKIAKISKRKEDYLKYIQYEIAVLSLIRKRREELSYFHKKSEIDNSIGKRINSLFKAVIKRFPDDIKLWISHHDFLTKMHWQDSMTSMHSRMLQIHNKSPDLWVLCAKWELEDNQSVDNSRNLLQRGLRFHPLDQRIWTEYFRMELMYVDQLLKRRKVLGLESRKKVEDDNLSDNILEGQIAIVIYQKATETIDDVQFALSFIPICEDFTFTSDIKMMIYTDIQTRHSNKEETWEALAKNCLRQHHGEEVSRKRFLRSCIENALIQFEKATQTLPTEKMWSLYIQFLLEKLQSSTSEKQAKKFLLKILAIMQEAADLKLLSLKMYIEWMRLLYSNQDIRKASNVALSASELFTSEPSIWQFCLTFQAQAATDSEFLETFYKAVAKVPSNKAALPLWQIAIEWALNNKVGYLEEILEKGLTQGPEVQVVMKKQYLELTAHLLRIDETRSLYRKLHKKPPLTLDFFEVMIAVEKSQEVPDIKRIRRCFDDAVFQLGDASIDIWLNYIQLEKEHPDGNPKAVAKLYPLAVKSLKPELSDEFINKYTLISNTHVSGGTQSVRE